MSLGAGAGVAVAAELAIGRAEVVAVGHHPKLQEVAADDESGIAAGAEGRDLVVAVKLLADAVAQRVRAVPEQLVEGGDVVGVERTLVAIEDARHLGDHRWAVDFPTLSSGSHFTPASIRTRPVFPGRPRHARPPVR